MGRQIFVREVLTASGTVLTARTASTNLDLPQGALIVAVMLPDTVDIHVEVAIWEQALAMWEIQLVVKSMLAMYNLISSSLSQQLSYTTSWQDLKDLFRSAGRAAPFHLIYIR